MGADREETASVGQTERRRRQCSFQRGDGVCGHSEGRQHQWGCQGADHDSGAIRGETASVGLSGSRP